MTHPYDPDEVIHDPDGEDAERHRRERIEANRQAIADNDRLIRANELRWSNGGTVHDPRQDADFIVGELDRERIWAQEVGEMPDPPEQEDDEDDGGWLAYYGNTPVIDDSMPDEAFIGPIGEFAKTMGAHRDPEGRMTGHTIVTPTGLLAAGLTSFSGMLGQAPYSEWAGLRTLAQLYVLLIGETGAGKGAAHRVFADSIYRRMDPLIYEKSRLITNINSGEGIVIALAKRDSIADGSTPAFFWVEEFTTVLHSKNRDNANTGEYLQALWDAAPLQRNTAKAGPEVELPAASMLTSTTPVNLREQFTSRDAASGFGNRFVTLPLTKPELFDPTPPPSGLAEGMADRMESAIRLARSLRGPVVETKEATELLRTVRAWQAEAESIPGPVGLMLRRVHHNVRRLALVYALSRTGEQTLTPVISKEDVLAAVAFMSVSERFAHEFWAMTPSSPRQATILNEVRQYGPDGAPVSAIEHGPNAAYRDTRQRDLAEMLDRGLLTKHKSEARKGWRLRLAAGREPTLWARVRSSSSKGERL